MAPLEFFFGADGLEVGDAVNAQNSVQVIDFVLEKLRQVAGFSGTDFMTCATEILIADRDFLVPLDLHENGEETEAGIPHDDFFVAALNDLRIDQWPGFITRKLQEDHALGDAELGSGDAAAVTGFAAPMGKGVLQIGNKCRELTVIRGEVVSRGFRAQSGITELQDFANGHQFPFARHP